MIYYLATQTVIYMQRFLISLENIFTCLQFKVLCEKCFFRWQRHFICNFFLDHGDKKYTFMLRYGQWEIEVISNFSYFCDQLIFFNVQSPNLAGVRLGVLTSDPGVLMDCLFLSFCLACSFSSSISFILSVAFFISASMVFNCVNASRRVSLDMVPFTFTLKTILLLESKRSA